MANGRQCRPRSPRPTRPLASSHLGPSGHACDPLGMPTAAGAGPVRHRASRSLARVSTALRRMAAGLARLATRKDCRYTLPCFARAAAFWARSSAVEHYLDMVGVTGSIPVAPTIQRPTERHRVMKVRNSLKSLRGATAPIGWCAAKGAFTSSIRRTAASRPARADVRPKPAFDGKPAARVCWHPCLA